jgi:hypothetical protein
MREDNYFAFSLSEESKTTTYPLVCVMISLLIVMITRRLEFERNKCWSRWSDLGERRWRDIAIHK